MTDSPELYVALGRLEEGVKFVRESQERMEKKLDAQDKRINQIELDVKELKTQRQNKVNTLSLWISIVAIVSTVVIGLLR
jgi:septal ring factor EnvC (AmiA/AmiB activator)